MKCPICNEETIGTKTKMWGCDFAHVNCIKAYSLGKEDAAALAAQPGSVPEGWKDVIDRVRDSMQHDQPSGYPGGNSGYREYAGCILDAVCDELDAIAAAPTEAKPAQDAVDARPLTTGELADVTAPWAHIWTDQSFGIANAAIDKFCEVNGIQRAAISAKKGGA